MAQFANININPNQVTRPIFNQNQNNQPVFGYDISLINGFNLNLTILPRRNGCNTTSCNFSLNNCSTDLTSENEDGEITGCETACDRRKLKEFCCLGSNNGNNNDRCNDYEAQFRAACPLSRYVSNRHEDLLNLCANHEFDVLYF